MGDDDRYVTVQRTQRRGHAVRYAYVVHRPRYWPYVSAYRYASAETAERAGLADLAALAGYDDEVPE